MKTLLPLAALSAALLAACSSRPVEEVQAEEATQYRDQADEALKAEDYVLAIELYTESLKLNASAAETWYRRANAYVKRPMDHDTPNSRREWIRQAERDYTTALRLNPALTTAYFNRAMVYMKTRRFLDAAKDLFEVTRLETTKSDMLRDAELYLGEIYLTKLEDQQVLGMEHYDQYVKLGGDRPDVVKLVREWRELKSSLAPAGSAPPPKAPSADDEAAAKQLHTRILSLIPKGEEQRPEVAKLLEELVAKYPHTKYVRDNEKGLKALLNAFKPKD
jgi:tetratricopeptide (TPR) repeat protein